MVSPGNSLERVNEEERMGNCDVTQHQDFFALGRAYHTCNRFIVDDSSVPVGIAHQD